MIDNFAIYSSCIVLLYVIWRAAVLDGTLPWFRPFHTRSSHDAENSEPRPEDAPVPPWRRR